MTAPSTETNRIRPSTDGVLSPDVQLWPYVPGAYGRDALYRVWQAMEADGANRQAFWDDASGGDLASFVKAFDGASDKVLLMLALDNQLAGCFWMTNIVMGHQCFVSMWMREASRGEPSVRLARQALRATFDLLGVRQVWALTPWAVAGALCRAVGFQRVATMPAFCKWEDAYKDVSLYRLTKEAFDGIGV